MRADRNSKMLAATGISQQDFAILYETLEPYFGVIERIGIFGSRATGRYESRSDVDLAIRGASIKTVNAVREALSESSFTLPFDLVSYELCDASIRAHIDRVEVAVWERIL